MRRRILQYLSPYRPLLWGATGVVCFSSLFGLLTPWPLQIIIDSVLGGYPLPGPLEGVLGWLRPRPYWLLAATIAGGLVLTLIQRILDLLNARVQTRLTNKLQLDLRSDLFDQAQKLALSPGESRRSGDILNRISVQAASIGPVALAFLPLSQSLITLLGMFWIAFLLDAQLALLSLLIVPFLYWSIGYYTRRIEPQVREVRQLEANSLSLINEAMRMLPVTVAFGRESDESRRFRQQSEQALDARLQLTVQQTVFSFGVNTAAAVGTALVIGVGAMHVLSGELTVGLLLVVLTYIGSVYTPLQAISGAVGSLQERLVDLRMACEMLESEPPIRDSPGAKAIASARGHLQFEDVCFSYDRRGAVLKDVSFEVHPGQFVGIVGPTGAGKTTLISLLPRFYEPDSGRIRLDGVELREIQLKSLRRQISLVTQEALLSSASIAENICYGRPEASPEEVVEAAKAAQIHSFVESLPKGYGSLAGELSARLSMGERQRLTLARAFLKNAPILVLDEPTSSLDARTERSLLEALRSLMRGRTTLMVAHRLSSVRHADLILVLADGKIAESGTHQELIQRDGLYRRLDEAHRSSREELLAPGARDPRAHRSSAE